MAEGHTKRTVYIRVASGGLMLTFSILMMFDWLPPPQTPQAASLLAALKATGYFYPTIWVVYTLIGACFVASRFVTLATFALAPMALNVTLFHMFLTPRTLLASLLVLVPVVSMARIQWRHIRPLLESGA